MNIHRVAKIEGYVTRKCVCVHAHILICVGKNQNKEYRCNLT